MQICARKDYTVPNRFTHSGGSFGGRKCHFFVMSHQWSNQTCLINRIDLILIVGNHVPEIKVSWRHRLTVVSWGGVWLLSHFRKASFTFLKLCIDRVDASYASVGWFSSVMGADVVAGWASPASRRIIISIPAWDFSDLTRFLHRGHILAVRRL